MNEKKPEPEIELRSDAWGTFERAVDRVAKAPPQHRTARKPEKPAPKRGREKSTVS